MGLWSVSSICDAAANEHFKTLVAKPPADGIPKSVNTNIVIKTLRTFIHSLVFEGPEVKKESTLVSADPSNQPEVNLPVVFIHGFGACAVVYQELLAKLGAKRTVYGIDMVGMGLSGKPSVRYDKMTTAEVIEFFVESIDAWAGEMGLKQFHLIGHSLGGYISAHYAHKRPQRVKSLVLLSPGGVVSEPADFQARLAAKKGLSLSTKIVKGMWWSLNKGWVHATTFGRFLPINWMVGKWSKDRFNYEDKALYTAAVGLIGSNLSHPWFSGDILPKIFGYRAYSTKPIVEFAKELEAFLDSKVVYAFGEKDWMDKYAFKQEYTKFGLRGSQKTIPSGTHHFPCLQPLETSELINEFLQSI